MQYTREQAAKKWCPFARASGDSDGVNRCSDGDGDAACTCLADYCMAWQWVEGDDGAEFEFMREYASGFYEKHCQPIIQPLIDEKAELEAQADSPAIQERLQAVDMAMIAAQKAVDHKRDEYVKKWLPEHLFPVVDGWLLMEFLPFDETSPDPVAVYLRPNKTRLGYCALMKK